MPIRLRGEPRPPAQDEEEVEEGRSAPLGALMHWALSLKHMFGRRRERGFGFARETRPQRPVGIGDVLARIKPGSDSLPERREPEFGEGGRTRVAARRPLEPVALDEEVDETIFPTPRTREARLRRRGASGARAARGAAPERELALPASSRVAAAAGALKPGRRLGRENPGSGVDQVWEYPPITAADGAPQAARRRRLPRGTGEQCASS